VPLTIRFVWFSATPKPEAKLDDQQMPAVFQNLQEGWPVPLSQDPHAFLARLAKEEPRYVYQLHLAGASVPLDNSFYVISSGPNQSDPLRHTVQETIRVLGWDSPTQLRTRRVGSLYYRAKDGNGVDSSGWDDTTVEEGNKQVLGLTKSMGIHGRPTETMTIYAFCFVKEEGPARTLAPATAAPAAHRR
jgi:hypothetical protein